MPSQYEYLSAVRINKILPALTDVRLLPQELIWSSRIPDVPSTDEEILARYQVFPQIADLVADDAVAPVYQLGRFSFETNKIPNLKVGINLNQQQIAQLQRLSAGFAGPTDVSAFGNTELTALKACVLGVRQRKELLFNAMLSDSLTYNRLGIQMSNVGWGMPSYLKITASTDWSTAGSATPVDDMLQAKMVARIRNGVVFDRASMSTQAFRYMIATTEFQNKSRQFLAPNVSFVNLSQFGLDAMQALAQGVLGMKVELDDARYTTIDQAGVRTQAPFHPVNKVYLTDSRMDGRSDMWNFANTVPIESIVASAGGANQGIPMAPGPIGYATVDPSLNPPSITYWGVARGFPRKNELQANACLTVGSFSDTIGTDIPFPS